jgi:hypothetical protein
MMVPSSILAVDLIERWAAQHELDFRSNALLGRGAVFSRCGTYRYLLWRNASLALPFMGLAMLNPSTANEEDDDPTITRGTGFARRERLAGPLVWNLNAFRATDPVNMKSADDPVGPHNNAAIALALTLAEITVAAWGTHGTFQGRDHGVRRRCAAAGAKLYALKLTKDGHPGHPLYLSSKLRPQPWEFDW